MVPHDGRSFDDRSIATDDVPSAERVIASPRAGRRGVARSEAETPRGSATTAAPPAFPASIPVGCPRVVRANG